MGFLTECKLRVGDGAEAAFEWTRENAAAVVDRFRDGAEAAIEAVVAVLQDPPNTGWLRDIPRREVEYLYPPDWHPFVVIGLLAALTFALHRRAGVTLLVLLGLLFVVNQGYWDETTESLTLVLFACAVCMAVGVPIGIAAAHRPALYRGMRPVLDLMQTLPTFVYLIPAIVFFGIGMVPGLIATVVFVLPAPIRLTHLGVSSTPKPLIEAVEAFGGTRRNVLWKAELPHALPQIMAGLNQTIMLSLSMVVIAALVGADGLGVPVVRALNSVNTGLGFESGIVIVVVAIMLDRMLRVDRRR
ncbi:choline ABC transporter permease subunit [Hasllibacter halocynthiae]|uniref:choline ABC transporter permease subunit n=1 Tax=Hasllibacter halocynthiae TaxID=595589 RepID=UPI000D05D85D|nr:choline ABC transporter permease subunit [Hasllibacter halocynthiae]